MGRRLLWHTGPGSGPSFAEPARIVAPDPRWFTLHKLWMSAQAKRNPLKRPKDEAQGYALLDAVKIAMSHYPLDEAFRYQALEQTAARHASSFSSPEDVRVFTLLFSQCTEHLPANETSVLNLTETSIELSCPSPPSLPPVGAAVPPSPAVPPLSGTTPVPWGLRRPPLRRRPPQ